MKKIILTVTVLVLILSYSYAQETRLHSHSLGLNYLQLKEGMNYGLVFRGPGLSYTYSSQWLNDRRVINYEAMFGLTYIESRSIPAGNFTIMPVKLEYLYKNIFSSRLLAGPYFMAEYNYQLYPDLQSGNSFWLTQYTVGGMLQHSFRIKNQLFTFSVSRSFFGLTSRQTEKPDPYFWHLSAGDIVKYLNQDLKFGVSSRYESTELKIKWSPGNDSRLIFFYGLSFTEYFKEPGLKLLNQSFKLTIRSKSR
jgi:hypothetical protein